eukprot:CAMPEP_0175724820 /NCGR_PEP_ID=MMETSP0097-20121207/47447_1 /TAXON_ID=311494 /ORGANISM="Alexandrium monilatum, Strain CCMP3105" /LENGTH=78 /DNA_ID=CAMNT_0017032587 /DNA_START=259 /DNA_END=492 /DNA_ORIENTATION=+
MQLNGPGRLRASRSIIFSTSDKALGSISSTSGHRAEIFCRGPLSCGGELPLFQLYCPVFRRHQGTEELSVDQAQGVDV